MTRKIFFHTLLVGLSVLLLCAVVFFGLQYTQTKDETRAALRQEAVCAANGIAHAGREYLETLESDCRITWIGADGEVLYDSGPGDESGNQSGLPEVRDALAEGEGWVIRRSESTGASTMYCAVRCEDGTVVRLSRALGAVRYALVTVSPVLWMAVLVLFVSAALAFRTAKQILAPVNAIDLDAPEAEKTYPELAPLVSRIEEQNLTIREREEELGRRQKEFSALTDSMKEGFLLLDRNGTVLSANQAAASLMPGCTAGESFDDHAPSPAKAAAFDALEGKRSEILLSDDDALRAVQLIANPVSSGGRLSGAVILTLDVTEREQRERLRREFSANVSHELKTPLTSISGFAELLMRGMVPEEKTAEFAGDIYRESRRMIALIEDIIKLSKLDEQGSGDESEWETVDLCEAARDALDSVRPAAEKENIVLTFAGNGERVEIRGVRRVLSEMIFNLCDNAVKYNKPGGEVTVSVEDRPEGVVLTVRDTGIGIPYAHRNRVFERFYRVDKSHSREIGGTGLGLSIVKHGAMLHGATIALDSEVGVGTTISVTFGKPGQQPKELKEPKEPVPEPEPEYERSAESE
ncbi:MAG: histidine kinase [Ruminococcaceae bacterium]|jgi:two-component system phosphate regulon sensor histidine kinase PhoR|nr:histidine kinase [Oscillospiraceae bacterium]